MMNLLNRIGFGLPATPALVPTPPVEEEIPRYPPFMKGLPAASVQRILASQIELVNTIEHDLSLPDELYQRIAAPVIERYAAFSHLLPASESHHHRGAGGLFRHGLEVAHLATQAAQGCLFASHATPKERKELELRWRLAVCFAGLLHDIGKPVSDMAVVDRTGQHTWNPCDENLTDWASQHQIEHYFLRWRDNRHKRHEQFSALVIERVLTRAARTYLLMPGPEIMQALLETIQGLDRGSKLFELVMAADCHSVQRDLKAHAHNGDTTMGMPVDRYLFDAMRRLIKCGKWLANDKGARVWRFKEGVHIVWRTGAQDIVELLAKDKVPGIPRDEDTLADILIERGLAIPKIADDGLQYRYWRMQPEGLAVTLYMLRLSAIELVFSSEPPVVVGGVEIEEAAETPEISEPTKTAEQQSIGQRPELSLSSKLETSTRTEEAEDKRGEYIGLSNSRVNAAIVDIATQPLSAQEPLSLVAVQPVQQSNLNAPIAESNLTETAKNWLKSQGQAGDWLIQLAQAINTGALQANLPIAEGHGKMLLPFPETADSLAVDSNEFIKTLDEKGWLVTDVLTPMRKVQVIAQVRGVLLAIEPSGHFKQLLTISYPYSATHKNGAQTGHLPTPKTPPAEKLNPLKNKREIPAKNAVQSVTAKPITDSPLKPNATDESAKPELPKNLTKTIKREIPILPIVLKSAHQAPSNSLLVDEFIHHIQISKPVNAAHLTDNPWQTIEDTDISQFLKQYPQIKRSAFIREMTSHPDCKTSDGLLKIKRQP